MKCALLIVFLFVVACQSQPSSSPQKGGILRIVVNEAFSDLNPFYNHSTYSAHIQELIFDKIINVDPLGQIKPALAKNWSLSPDGLKWTFTLYPQILFHDNLPLTTKDILFTLETVKKIGGVFQSVTDNIESIRSLDALTFEIILSKPDQAFPLFLRTLLIVPWHVYNDKGQFNHVFNSPIGSGPFVLQSFTHDQVTLKANKNYFDGAPHIDQAEFIFIKDNSVALSELIAGKIDFQAFFDPQHEAVLSNLPHLKHIDSSSWLLFGIFFNTQNPLFQQKEIRQALNETINKETIITHSTLQNKSLMATSPVAPNSPYFNTQVPAYPFDTREAEKLFGSNGWVRDKKGMLTRNGKIFEFELMVPEGCYLTQKVLGQILMNFSSMGIKAKIKLLPMNDIIQKVFVEKKYETVFIHYSSELDLLSSKLFWAHPSQAPYNFTSFSNREAAELLQASINSKNTQELSDNYKKFQWIMHEDPPLIYLFWLKFPLFYNKRVGGITTDAFSDFGQIKNLWISNENIQ